MYISLSFFVFLPLKVIRRIQLAGEYFWEHLRRRPEGPKIDFYGSPILLVSLDHDLELVQALGVPGWSRIPGVSRTTKLYTMVHIETPYIGP